MMFASSGSGGGGGYDDDDDYGYDDDYGFEEEPPQEEEPARRRPQSNRTRRAAGRANADGGRSRSASVQPDERYWTDYLRIALPVIGIILMLGLLWIWASSLLGGDDTTIDSTPEDTVGLVQAQTPDPNSVNTEPNQSGTPAANQQTGTNTGEIPISGQETAAATNPVVEPPVTQPAVQGGDNQTGAAPTPTEVVEAPPADTDIAVDGRVRITEVMNIRPSAGTVEEPIGETTVGEEATVLSGPEEADGYTWWEVVFDNGSSGFVIEEYLEPIP